MLDKQAGIKRVPHRPESCHQGQEGKQDNRILNGALPGATVDVRFGTAASTIVKDR